MWFLITLLLIGFAGIFGIDLYLPSLPAIGQHFAATQATVQFSVPVYLFGLILFCLIYGPLADKYGRKLALSVGFALGISGNFLCFSAPSIDWLLIGRFISGAGMAASVSLARTLLADKYEGKQLAIIASTFSLCVGLGIIVAPGLGGYLQAWFGWQAAFVFLMILQAIALGNYLITGKDEVPKSPDSLKLKKLFNNYFKLLSDKPFAIFTSFAALSFGVILAYATLSAYLFQKDFALTAVQYGWISMIVGAANFTGKFFNTLFIRRYSIKAALFLGYSIMGLAGLTMLISLSLGYLNLILVTASIVLATISLGFIFSNVYSAALMNWRHLSSVASSLYTTIQFSGGFLVSFILAMIASQAALGLGVTYLLLAIVGILLLFKLGNKVPK